MRFKYFIIFLLISSNVRSQVLLSESFEGVFPPVGWTMINEGQGNQAWEQNTAGIYSFSGSKSMRCYASPFFVSNVWAITPSLSLNKNTLYRISYWYNTGGGYSEKMRVTMGSNPSSAGQNKIIHNYINISNASFLQGVDTISVNADGNYYFGFNYYSNLNQGKILIDSIVIKQVPKIPCSGTPSIGIASAPTEIAPDSNFILNLSGNYIYYSGINFQWQSSILGSNNFININGATSASFTTSETINKDYRCLVTCSNSAKTVISNTVSVTCANTGSLFREKLNNSNLSGSINGVYFLNASQGFAAFANYIGYTQDSGKTFGTRNITMTNTDYNGYSVNLTFGFMPNGVHAFSNNTLLIYGHYGAEPSILYSADQGLHWKLVFHQPLSPDLDIENTFFDMKFWDNLNGVAINQKYLIQTYDGGQTWDISEQIPINADTKFSKLSLINGGVGYATAGNKIFKAVDFGGWSPLNNLPSNTGLNFNNISFVSEDIGYVSKDDDGALYKTINGGTSWIKVNEISPVVSSDLYFTNENTGYIALPDEYRVVKTINGGRTWEYCKKDIEYQFLGFGLNRLFFLNDQIGWACGNGEYIMLTTTGGSPTIPKTYFKVDTTNLTSGGIVDLINYSKPFYQYKWYKNGVLLSTSYNCSYVRDKLRIRDTVTLILSTGGNAVDSLTQYPEYPIYYKSPVIASFSPTNASAYTLVNISGVGFIGVTSVTFGNIPAKSFVVNSNESITAIVMGGSSGDVTVSTATASFSLSGFIYNLPIAPVITSFYPTNGPVSTVVTIQGNNFNSILENNIVFFGKIKARVVNATNSKLICVVPAGCSYSPISVINKINNLSASSFIPFDVTFTGGGAITATSFSNIYNISTFNQGYTRTPTSVNSGDIDGDGKNDIITSEQYNLDSIYVYRNLSTGYGNISFESRKRISRGSYSSINDIDGDGKLDVISLMEDGINVSRNISSGSNILFSNTQVFAGPGGSKSVAIRDLDGDGRSEIVLAGYNEGRVGILRNLTIDSTISFAPLLQVPTDGNSRAVAVGDLNNDGKPDIVASGNDHISIFKNNSTPENILLAPKFDILGNADISKIFIVDIDNDGKLDIIIIYANSSSTFSIFKNISSNGNISFGPKLDVSSNDVAFSGDIADLDGDKSPDLVTARFIQDYFYIFKNLSSPDSIKYNTGIGFHDLAWDICSSDLDGDGKTDLFTANPAYYQISVFRNMANGLPLNIPACSGGYISYLSNYKGSTYQWEVDNGTGYIPIADDANYFGSKTSELTISNIPSTWNGYKYKCLVDNSTNSEVNYLSVLFSNTWTGKINNLWSNPGNWSCGTVPDANTNVAINSGTVVVNVNANARSMYINPGVNFTVSPGINLQISH